MLVIIVNSLLKHILMTELERENKNNVKEIIRHLNHSFSLKPSDVKQANSNFHLRFLNTSISRLRVSSGTLNIQLFGGPETVMLFVCV